MSHTTDISSQKHSSHRQCDALDWIRNSRCHSQMNLWKLLWIECNAITTWQWNSIEHTEWVNSRRHSCAGYEYENHYIHRSLESKSIAQWMLWSKSVTFYTIEQCQRQPSSNEYASRIEIIILSRWFIVTFPYSQIHKPNNHHKSSEARQTVNQLIRLGIIAKSAAGVAVYHSFYVRFSIRQMHSLSRSISHRRRTHCRFFKISGTSEPKLFANVAACHCCALGAQMWPLLCTTCVARHCVRSHVHALQAQVRRTKQMWVNRLDRTRECENQNK